MDWDNDAVKAAAAYLRELIDAGAADERTRTVDAGLLDELDAKHGAVPRTVREDVRRDAKRIFRAR